jgi:hypothetical protein
MGMSGVRSSGSTGDVSYAKPNWNNQLIKSNRSQVQRSTFRVKDKEGIEDPKASLKRLISPSNCQFGSKFWITPDEADAFFVNTHPKYGPGTIMEL